MRAGEEGSPGSFEVLWEANDWAHSRLLHSRLATGKMPKAPAHGFHPIVEVRRECRGCLICGLREVVAFGNFGCFVLRAVDSLIVGAWSAFVGWQSEVGKPAVAHLIALTLLHPSFAQSVLRMLLGPTMPPSKYPEWHALITKNALLTPPVPDPGIGSWHALALEEFGGMLDTPSHVGASTLSLDGELPSVTRRPMTVQCGTRELKSSAGRPLAPFSLAEARSMGHVGSHKHRPVGDVGLYRPGSVGHGSKKPLTGFYRPPSRTASLPELLHLGGPVGSRTGKSFMQNQLFTPNALLTPLLAKLDASRLADRPRE